MGVELKARGLAQVSINLTDFEQNADCTEYTRLVKRRSATATA